MMIIDVDLCAVYDKRKIEETTKKRPKQNKHYLVQGPIIHCLGDLSEEILILNNGVLS